MHPGVSFREKRRGQSIRLYTYADIIGSEKDGDRGENEGKGRQREAKRERERSPTVIPHGTKRREDERARACNVCRLQECHYVSFARVR